MKGMFRAKRVTMVAAAAACLLALGRGGLLAADAAPATGEKPAQNQTEDWMAALRKGWAEKDAYARDWDRKTLKPVRIFSHGGRVPMIVLTHEGTLLAFQEKYVTAGDLGDHDMVVVRSTDGGKTWSEDLLIYDAGKANCNHAIPIVAADGTVWLTFTIRLKEVFITHSRDDGRTWAEPKVIATEKRVWTGHHSILHSSGRMLFAANDEGKGDQWCYYSDDHGATWKKSGPFGRGGLQTSLLELVDGTVYANMRRFGKPGRPNHRSEAWSRDGGMTWSGTKRSEHLLDAGSIGCSSSVIRVTDERVHDRNRVIFCGPDDGGDPKKSLGRVNGTAYISYDECRTWKKCKRIVDGPFGYSDLVLLPDMSVGCVYESGGGYKCSFARFTVEWITDGEDKVDFSKFKKK